jgi:ceramidase
VNKRNPQIFVFALCFAVFVTALFFVALYNHWFGSASNLSIPFCEAPRPGLIKEPANTWSNVGFIIAGLYISWILSTGKFSGNVNSFTRNKFYAIFYPCLVIFLGPGSMAMHASKTHIGGFFDMLSMYLIAAFITSYAMQRFFGLKWWGFTLIFLTALATCIWANFTYCPIVFSFFGNTAFAFYLVLGSVFEILNIYVKKLRHQTRWAYFALAAILVAFAVWNVSQTGDSLCNPDSLLQGHAIWHLGDALSAFFLFRYYVSENV